MTVRKEEETIPPAGLHPRLVRRLLDKLEHDHHFRELFQKSPEAALRSIGYVDPWSCLQLRSGAKLASPEQIRAQRDKLEDNLVSVQRYDCVLDAQLGYFKG
ncbi:MAG: NHLP-related RiPP peptide [Pseudoxanthomonas sp.]